MRKEIFDDEIWKFETKYDKMRKILSGKVIFLKSLAKGKKKDRDILEREHQKREDGIRKRSFAYMVRCADGSLYSGWTTDPEKRAKAHNEGKGAKYTRARRPVELVYVEELPTKEEAMSREYALKQLTHLEKEELIKKGRGKMEIKKEIIDRFEFREAKPEEGEETAEIEAICFPPNEACSRKHMLERAEQAADTFLVAVDRENGKIAGFLNGLATDEEVFRDEFFTDIKLHKKDGKNIMLLGLDVRPEYRGQGLARAIVSIYSEKEKSRGRKKLFLTCVEGKVSMYERMGFLNLGLSGSVWGGTTWYDMRKDL